MISCIVLAGGKSSRMNKSYYKAVLPLAGKPLIMWPIDSLRPVVDEFVIVVKNEDQRIELGRYLDNVAIVQDDKRFGLNNPLVGALTGALKARGEIIFIVCCDQPFITSNVVSKTVNYCRNFEACVPRWPNGFLEPLTAAYRRREYIDAVKKSLEENKLKCTAPLKYLKVYYVNVYELAHNPKITFYNINTVEDYRNAWDIVKGMLRNEAR